MKIELTQKEYNIISEGLMKMQQQEYAALSTAFADSDIKLHKERLQEVTELRDKLKQIKENEKENSKKNIQ